MNHRHSKHTARPQDLSSLHPDIEAHPPPDIPYPPNLDRIYSQVYGSLLALNQHAKASRFHRCFRAHVPLRCLDCHTIYYLPWPCHLRICPKCSSWRAQERYIKYQEPLHAMREPKLLTLTYRSKRILTPAVVDDCRRQLRNFRYTELYKDHVKGGIMVTEFTYSSEGWHPHVHALLDSSYIHQPLISEAWKGCTGGAYIVYIQAVDRHAGYKEISKYPYKPGPFLSDPELVGQILDAIYKKHLTVAVGSFYRAGTPYEPLFSKPFPPNIFDATNIYPRGAPRKFQCDKCEGTNLQVLDTVYSDPPEIPAIQTHLRGVPGGP